MSLPDALPLMDSELAELAAFLAGCRGGRAMNLETLDGFFCALIAGPELVMPSEYWPHALGGQFGEVSAFRSLEEANHTLQLLMRHWNTIAVSLDRGERYSPLFARDVAHPRAGTDWADGFMQGVNLRGELWSPLIESTDGHVQWTVLPMMLLAHDKERASNPNVQPLKPHERAELLARVTLSLPEIHQFFRESRKAFSGPIGRPTSAGRPGPAPATTVRASPKVGRNEPCPCGSGRKFKHCCGGIDATSTMH